MMSASVLRGAVPLYERVVVPVDGSALAKRACPVLLVSEKHALDLIAISPHGRGTFGRVLFGGTAEKVARGAQTPVLVVRPPHALTS